MHRERRHSVASGAELTNLECACLGRVAQRCDPVVSVQGDEQRIAVGIAYQSRRLAAQQLERLAHRLQISVGRNGVGLQRTAMTSGFHATVGDEHKATETIKCHGNRTTARGHVDGDGNELALRLVEFKADHFVCSGIGRVHPATVGVHRNEVRTSTQLVDIDLRQRAGSRVDGPSGEVVRGKVRGEGKAPARMQHELFGASLAGFAGRESTTHQVAVAVIQSQRADRVVTIAGHKSKARRIDNQQIEGKACFAVFIRSDHGVGRARPRRQRGTRNGTRVRIQHEPFGQGRRDAPRIDCALHLRYDRCHSHARGGHEIVHVVHEAAGRGQTAARAASSATGRGQSEEQS